MASHPIRLTQSSHRGDTSRSPVSTELGPKDFRTLSSTAITTWLWWHWSWFWDRLATPRPKTRSPFSKSWETRKYQSYLFEATIWGKFAALNLLKENGQSDAEHPIHGVLVDTATEVLFWQGQEEVCLVCELLFNGALTAKGHLRLDAVENSLDVGSLGSCPGPQDEEDTMDDWWHPGSIHDKERSLEKKNYPVAMQSNGEVNKEIRRRMKAAKGNWITEDPKKSILEPEHETARRLWTLWSYWLCNNRHRQNNWNYEGQIVNRRKSRLQTLDGKECCT